MNTETKKKKTEGSKTTTGKKVAALMRFKREEKQHQRCDLK